MRVDVKKASWFAKSLYSGFLRAVIKSCIDDPDDSWDEKVIEILDDIFDYDK